MRLNLFLVMVEDIGLGGGFLSSEIDPFGDFHYRTVVVRYGGRKHESRGDGV